MYYKEEETNKEYKQAKWKRMQAQARERLDKIADFKRRNKKAKQEV